MVVVSVGAGNRMIELVIANGYFKISEVSMRNMTGVSYHNLIFEYWQNGMKEE